MLQQQLPNKQNGAFAHTLQTGLTKNSIFHIKQSDKQDIFTKPYTVHWTYALCNGENNGYGIQEIV